MLLLFYPKDFVWKYKVNLYVNKIRMQRKLALDNQLVFRRDVFILQLPVLRYTINSYEFYDLYFKIWKEERIGNYSLRKNQELHFIVR